MYSYIPICIYMSDKIDLLISIKIISHYLFILTTGTQCARNSTQLPQFNSRRHVVTVTCHLSHFVWFGTLIWGFRNLGFFRSDWSIKRFEIFASSNDRAPKFTANIGNL